MNFLLSFVFFIFSTHGYAAWTTTNCSNSDGSVKWQSGQEDELIDLKYSNFVEGFLTLNIDQVNIEFKQSTSLRTKKIKNLNMSGTEKVYAASIKITASEKHPDILRSQFPKNMIETDVICTTLKIDDDISQR